MSNVIWPVPANGPNGTYTFTAAQDFGARVVNGVSGTHWGLDFGRDPGVSIVAIAGGVVDTRQDNHWSAGNHIIINHGGYRSGYKHMLAGSHHHLQPGTPIAQGQPVGQVGNTGESYGAHLHLDIYLNGARVDPEPYLRGATLPGGGSTTGRAQHDMELYAATPPSTIPAKYLALNGGLVPGLPTYMLIPAVGIPRVTQDQVLVMNWAQSIFGQTGNTAVIQISWGWFDQLFDQHAAIAQSLGA